MAGNDYCYIHRCPPPHYRCGPWCYESKIHKGIEVKDDEFGDTVIPACGSGRGTPSGHILTCRSPLPPEGITSVKDIENLNLCKRCFKHDIPVLDRMAGI